MYIQSDDTSYEVRVVTPPTPAGFFLIVFVFPAHCCFVSMGLIQGFQHDVTVIHRAQSRTVYADVWYAGTSLVGLKSHRHFFLADSHTSMLLPTSKQGGGAGEEEGAWEE